MLKNFLVILSLFIFAQSNPIVEEISNGNPMLGKFFIKSALILLVRRIFKKWIIICYHFKANIIKVISFNSIMTQKYLFKSFIIALKIFPDKIYFEKKQMNKGVAQIPNSAYGLWPSGRIPYVFSSAFSI